MKELEKLIELISRDPNCIVYKTNSEFVINRKIPDDLDLFFKLTNGVSLFENESFGIKIIGREEFISTNRYLYPEDDIIWEELDGDITNEWFLIAKNPELDQYISIDLTSQRLGKCYDSYLPTHGEEGMSEIIAKSFTELLWNLYSSNGKGDNWYWNNDNFEKIGDAFD
ncbi:SMI1/KNR4 family protein [Tenacibaculum sp. M341]|uniref:SMI1/KNR4 family protein n=1 Tax=Tenacibaculum sp. M341 TaxID=2530339 RepID=UPI00104F9EC7|nr:SMI1/KNR4 family protein [Tenacibaculum sp. M341]TCI89989.1 SMI1/KNR4 family protein [Tenacibaculum sp. M341]